MDLGLLCHISVQNLEEPKMSQTSVNVVFTQDRCDLWLSTVDCMMQFSNDFLHLRLWLLKLVKGKPNGGIECRNLLENCIRERGVVAQWVRLSFNGASSDIKYVRNI